MDTGKKQKLQTPNSRGGAPKSILKTPKPSVFATPQSQTPKSPKADAPKPLKTPKPSVSATPQPATQATPKSPTSTPSLKSILKKPKSANTPSKISLEPAKVPTLKQSKTPASTGAISAAPKSLKKASPNSNLKGVSSPYPIAAKPKKSPFPQSNGAKTQAKSVQKLPQLAEQEDSEDDDEDVDVGAFALGSDEEDDDDEAGFDVESQIARALSTKPASSKAVNTPAQKPSANNKTKQSISPSTTKATLKQASTPKQSKVVVPQLSESDDDDDDVDMNAALGESDEEDAVPPSQLKNWKALASKTLTGKEPITRPSTADLGSGLPSVPRSTQNKGQAKTAAQNASKTAPQSKAEQKKATEQKGSPARGKQGTDGKPKAEGKQAGKPAHGEQGKGAQKGNKQAQKETKPEPNKKVQMFDDSDEALDYDGEGDEGEEEAAIARALHKKGDFSDLVRGKNTFADEDEGDEGDEGDMGEEDEDEGDVDYENEELPIEKAAKRLAAMEKRVERESKAELQTNMQEVQTFQLPSGQEIEQEKLVAPDLTLLNQRIQDVLFTLADFRNKKQPEHSRTEYMERLAQDLTTYYGYLPELIERFLELFSPAEAVEFLMANEAQRPVTLRVNSLKTRRGDLIQTLSKRGIHVEPLADWTKVGCKVTMSKLPLGATPEYMAGHYVLQSAASFLPVMALAPQEHERVLDMCASPGGKATYIAALMKNTGMLVANDANAKRLASLTGNIHRLGVRNSVVTNFDGRKLKKHFGLFDRILLDAPCSGLGVISKDPSVKTTKTNKDIQRSSHVQKELALAAIDMLDGDSKTGGYLVYSTCSISVEENEEVVDYLLNHRHVKIVETNIPFGVIGLTRFRTKQFHPSLSLARRFYPHVHNMDGFFVCKLKKLADGPKAKSGTDETEVAESAPEPVPEAVQGKKAKRKAEKEPPAAAPAQPASVPTKGKAKTKPKHNKASANGTPTPQGQAQQPMANANGTPTPQGQAQQPTSSAASPQTAVKRKPAKKAGVSPNGAQPSGEQLSGGQPKKQKVAPVTALSSPGSGGSNSSQSAGGPSKKQKAVSPAPSPQAKPSKSKKAKAAKG